MSEMVIEGVVNKRGQNKAKFWNVEIDGEWYSLGKDAPKYDKGDTIRFTYTKNGQWNNGDSKSIEIVAKSQAAPAAAASSSSGGSSSENWDARAKYWADKDKADVVRNKEQRYRFCLASAKDIVIAAVEANAFVLSEAKKKNSAFDSLMVYVQETASVLYDQIETFMQENALEDDAKYALPDDNDKDSME